MLILTTLLILIILTKTARAESISPPDLIMHVGSIAPFSGVLINENQYRSFTVDHREAVDFRAHLDDYVKCNPPPLVATGEVGVFVKGFGLGVIITLLGIIALH